MKKLFAFLLALIMILALAACGESAPETAAETEAPAEEDEAFVELPDADAAEEDADELSDEPDDPGEEYDEPEEGELTGLWYCSFGTANLSLELREDGSYTVAFPKDPESTVTGVWEEREGFLYLDGDETAPLAAYGELLAWPAAGVYLSREEPAPLYVPAQPLDSLPQGILDGYWVAAFLDLDGEVFSVLDLGESMDLYVEGERAAMGGPIFGDQIVDLEVEADGSLCFAGEGFRVDMTLQSDGFMRLTLSTEGGDELVYYLYNATPVEDSELEDA